MPAWPLLKMGVTGERVKTLQRLLNSHGATLTVDGDFEAITKAAVEQFQGAESLPVDGEAGDATWPKLIVEAKAGDTGDAVKAVQGQIRSRIGRPLVDGIFGTETESLVRSFQRDLGLNVDGIVGPVTWNRLVNGYLSSADGTQAGKSLFQAWSQHDKASAARSASPGAVTTMFSRVFSASDGWAFAGSNGAAGSVGVEWTGPGGTLVLLVNNNAGEPFFFVRAVQFP